MVSLWLQRYSPFGESSNVSLRDRLALTKSSSSSSLSPRQIVFCEEMELCGRMDRRQELSGLDILCLFIGENENSRLTSYNACTTSSCVPPRD